ncbi:MULTISPECIES: hypothetical protein [unclassified Nocardioides]|uniref:hypothetical protein n=1 Tax=unclassified Nocardioides TaxID=2615069 RepID=UPI0007025DC3|nr:MULTISPECIES: hypothetical protein [unclassified Nocardioides]KRC53931.1 hypothetical protein ASE19_07575 [Nocardioides sp. Root79]KRC71267.1 hypothetical protein ASE20_09990 [Nocardioides sp. Root240]
MTAMTLDLDRIQHLASTAGYPPLTTDTARRIVGVIAGTPDPADDSGDEIWDLAWAVATHLLEKLSPQLADDVMEVGWIAEQIYPICRDAAAVAGEVA